MCICVYYYRCHWRRDWTKLFNISARSWNIKPIINIFPNPRQPGWRKADQDTTREQAFSQGCWDRSHVASSSHLTLRYFSHHEPSDLGFIFPLSFFGKAGSSENCLFFAFQTCASKREREKPDAKYHVLHFGFCLLFKKMLKNSSLCFVHSCHAVLFDVIFFFFLN